jgi:hypothetical protein
MSSDILATVTRDGTVIYGSPIPIAFQLDFATEMEQHGGYGMVPSYRYEGYCPQILDIRQNDYLQDTVNKDPVTNTPVQYQIVGKPEKFPDGHMEFKADDRRTVNFS